MGASAKPPTGGISGFFRRIWHTLVFYFIGIRTNLVEIFTFHKKFDLKKAPRRPAEVAVITGGARGIGLEVVKKLLILDMHVVIGCRSKSSGTKPVESIRSSGITTGTTNILELDLLSLDSVREFATKVNLKYPKIHLLINNGGIMAVPYAISKDSNESQFQVNYLSHFLLTNLLLPKLIRGGRAGKTSRIVNVSSVAHYGGKIDFEDINMQKMYSKNMAYMASKLMQVASTLDLDSKLSFERAHVRVYSVHPGVVKTDLYNDVCIVRALGFIFNLFFKTPEQGADCVLYAAISSKFEGEGGHFFRNCKKSSVNSSATKVTVQKRLWDLSCQLTGWPDLPMSQVVRDALAAARTGAKISLGLKEEERERKISAGSKGGGGPVAKRSESRKGRLERQDAVLHEDSDTSGNADRTPVDTDTAEDAEKPRISIDSGSSSITTSVSSANTVIGNDLIAVVIIPATATEISSSSSDEEDKRTRAKAKGKAKPYRDREQGNSPSVSVESREAEVGDPPNDAKDASVASASAHSSISIVEIEPSNNDGEATMRITNTPEANNENPSSSVVINTPEDDADISNASSGTAKANADLPSTTIITELPDASENKLSSAVPSSAQNQQVSVL